jgi:cell division transport system permease protein
MAPTNVGYSFKEAISHFFRNWTTSLGAVITIFLSLFIIGLFIMGSAMLNSVIGTVEDQVVINAFISDDADQADVQAFEAELKTWSNVIRIRTTRWPSIRARCRATPMPP